jgi:HSP20 family protein
MTLTRWNPVTGLAALEVGALNRMFDAAFNHGDAFGPDTWVPAVDILETAGKDIVVKAELPDVKREDIKITVENNVLTIEGERKLDRAPEAGKYQRVERSYGAFRRSFSLSAAVDTAKVAAEYRDGVLTITLPRREESRARQIQVNG